VEWYAKDDTQVIQGAQKVVRIRSSTENPMATVLAWPGSVRPGPFSRLYYAAFSRTHLSAVEPD